MTICIYIMVICVYIHNIMAICIYVMVICVYIHIYHGYIYGYIKKSLIYIMYILLAPLLWPIKYFNNKLHF